MSVVLNIYKPQGMTPLQALDAVREKHPEYRNEKMTYAGRLDPMAEGVLVVLVGDAVHEKEGYLNLDKIYEADIVFGIGTDTHDLLGLATFCEYVDINNSALDKAIGQLHGAHEFPYPAYASKPVNGKPLFQWAREGRLDEIEIPKRIMRVHESEMLDRYEVGADALKDQITECIGNVQGDFRQEEILNKWSVIFGAQKQNTAFLAVRLRVHCASGAYIRTLAHELGKRLGTDAVLMKLVRTRVGDFKNEDSLSLV